MAKVNKFGTFSGVFTPSILTILGVIMYLRLPMIVGEAGLWGTLGIIIIAHIISITTGLSVSSIATDKKVEAGGTYYMISRSLGLPIGGTLGLALFVGLSFSVSLYLIGFAESFLVYWGYDVSINTIRIAGTTVLLVVTAITLISTSLALKTQYFIMGAIILSLISIFFGQHEFAPVATVTSDSAVRALPFMVLFGIFFPAVTGFEAGVSMSGDLQDPKKSIPSGSIMAILVGLIVYIGLTFFFSYTVDHQVLASDPQVLLKISWIPSLVIVGIWGATLSSALGSILGAPRILQATAIDKISPRFFAKGVGASNEPRNALLLTFVIAEAGILIGDLDIIARIVTIFFITTYAFINLSCAFEAWTSADFRPSFKTPVWVSLLGAIACFIVMIELDFVATLGASIILGILYLFLKRKELSLQTGDAWAGVWSSLAKTSLQHLSTSKQHTRNWRPNILMFNGADEARPFMMKLGHAISGHLGLLSSFEIIHSKDAEGARPQLKQENADEIKKDFHYTYASADIYGGIDEITRIYGFPGIEPNTVLMGWSKKQENKEKFIKLITALQQYNLNSLFLHHNNTIEKKSAKPTIDIWWSGWGRNLSLALNILRHLTRKDPWSRASIRLCIINNDPDDTDKINRYVRNIFKEYRTQASIRVIDNNIAQQDRKEIIKAESATTDLTIVGIPDSFYEDMEAVFHFANTICEQLPTVLFINASNTFEESSVITQNESVGVQQQTEWVLPEIPVSTYPELNIDISKIDAHGQQLVERLHKKVFATSLELESAIYKKIQTLAGSIQSSMDKALGYDTPYQSVSAMMRAKKYFINQLQLTFDNALAVSIKNQEEALTEGIQWYLDQLQSIRGNFPKEKIIAYNRAEFKPHKEDDAATRWFKFTKSIFHPFAGKTISLKINYREGGTYFFRDTRYQFLAALLTDLEKNIRALHNRLSQLITWTDTAFHLTMDAQDTPKARESVADFTQQLAERTDQLIQQASNLQSLYKGRLQTEYRKNVIHFLHQLENIEFDNAIQRKKKPSKFYSQKKDIITNFPSQWASLNHLELSTLKAHTFLYDYFGFVQQQMQNYTTKLKQFFTKEQQPVTELIETLKGIETTTDEKQPSLPDWNFNLDFPTEALQETSEQLLLATRNLPDEIMVALSGEAEEGLLLPIRAMVAHLVETTLTGPISDKIETTREKIKRSNLVINDHASLAMFNVFNLKETDEETIRTGEIKAALNFIQHEVKNLQQLTDDIMKAADQQMLELKHALKLSNFSDIAGDFSQLLRDQQTRKLQTRVTGIVSKVKQKINRVSVNILYSQTKGILLARQLSSPSQGLSVNEKIINVVNSTSVNPAILQKLPHYYVSLFSGRSSIGDNFWVSRTKEEAEFEQAYDRYKNGNHGIILVLGERNSGKTALCKRFAEKTFTSSSSYHIFPPEGGSINIDDFERILQKTTKFEGNSWQVFNLLPHNSVVILHDLELWWERSAPDGLTMIRHIKTLIQLYASKCLFVANLNPFAFTVINTAEPLDLLCAGVVRCRPLNSFELKQLVMTRHKSSGLAIDFGSGAEETFSEIKLARVFNNLFSYSKGNPGVAMNAWLLGINDFKSKSIVWKTPPSPDDEVFLTMPETWGHLCLQLLLHKRMDTEKITRCVQLDHDQIIKALQVMRRLQLLSTRGDSLYYLNPSIEFLLVNHFKEKEWI